MKIDLKKRGFTLIELLVVIAIIGILSSVVIASLNSARDRAEAAKVNANVKVYIDAINRHYIDNGHYPEAGDFGNYGYYCIGHVNEDESCLVMGTDFYENNVLNADLAEYVPGLPAISTKIYDLGDDILFQGATYSCENTGEICNYAQLYWFVKSPDCAIGEESSSNGFYDDSVYSHCYIWFTP